MKNWILQTIAKTAKNQKIGQKLAGKTKSNEHKKAISTALKGRKLSDETREKMRVAALNRKKRRRKVWTDEERLEHGNRVATGKARIPAKTKIRIRQKQSVAMKRRQDARLESLRMDHGFGLLRPCRLDCRLPLRHYETIFFHAPDEPARMTNEQFDFLNSLVTSPNLGLDKWREKSRRKDEWLVISRPNPQTIAFHGVRLVQGGNQKTKGILGSGAKVWNIEDAEPRKGFVAIGNHYLKGESRILKIQTPAGRRYLLVMDIPHFEPRPRNPPRPGSRPPGRPKA